MKEMKKRMAERPPPPPSLLTGDKHPTHIRGSDPVLAHSSLGITSTADSNLESNQMTGEAPPPYICNQSALSSLSPPLICHPHILRVIHQRPSEGHRLHLLSPSLDVCIFFVYKSHWPPPPIISPARRDLIMKDLAELTYSLIWGALVF